MNEQYDNLKIEQALAPVAVAADTTSDVIDLQGYKHATIVLAVGVITDGTYAAEVQESDTTTAGDFKAVADADLLGSEPTGLKSDTDGALFKVGYIGNKRYLRVVITETAAGTTGGVMAIVAIKGGPMHAPVA